MTLGLLEELELLKKALESRDAEIARLNRMIKAIPTYEKALKLEAEIASLKAKLNTNDNTDSPIIT